jgi:hypothetical protein
MFNDGAIYLDKILKLSSKPFSTFYERKEYPNREEK